MRDRATSDINKQKKPSFGLRFGGIFGGAIAGVVLSAILFFIFSEGNDDAIMRWVIVGAAVGSVLGFIFPRPLLIIGEFLGYFIPGF